MISKLRAESLLHTQKSIRRRLAALGRRREAAAAAVRHLRGIWRYPNSWLPLVYSVTPAALLKRKRPEYRAMFEDPRPSVSE